MGGYSRGFKPPSHPEVGTTTTTEGVNPPMWKRVTEHSLYWAAHEKSGTVMLTLEDASQGSLRHLSKVELAAFGELLRHEPVVWYHSTRGDLTTEKHPFDEEERC